MFCKYDERRCGQCHSAVAQVNAMVLRLKASGLTKAQIIKIVKEVSQ